MERRALSLAERNITKTEVSLITGGVMLSRLLGAVLYYVELNLEQEIAQLKFYFELEDMMFIKLSVNRNKDILKGMDF